MNEFTIMSRRFGPILLTPEHQAYFDQGLVGFAPLKRFCIIDPGDDTLILWLQSIDNPALCFPIIEPKLILSDYRFSLPTTDYQTLGIKTLQEANVFSILTIPENIALMTVNLKAPLVISQNTQKGLQIILSENIYSIKEPAYKPLRMTISTATEGLLAPPSHRPMRPLFIKSNNYTKSPNTLENRFLPETP
jgi:flagellar assembly factor FliW